MKKYRIMLEAEERKQLQEMLSKGKADVRRLKHAQILLAADESEGSPAQIDMAIAKTLQVGTVTIERVRHRFVEEGLEMALSPYKSPQRRYTTKLDGRQEARLIAIACFVPPEGHARWTLRLLADKFVALKCVDSISHETVRQTLKKMNSSPT